MIVSVEITGGIVVKLMTVKELDESVMIVWGVDEKVIAKRVIRREIVEKG